MHQTSPPPLPKGHGALDTRNSSKEKQNGKVKVIAAYMVPAGEATGPTISECLHKHLSSAISTCGTVRPRMASSLTRRVLKTTCSPPTGSAPARRRPAPEDADTEAPPNLDEEGTVRLPRSVQALYLQPLRRVHRWGVPTCDLQMRSYSVPNLEFFCDFALRAAYYLKLPTYGPVPLPRMIERWTVPKSPFIFKKSQENFERITVRRLIQIRDGHPQSVQIWLAFLQKHAYYGIGMKANIWEYSKIDFGEQLDAETKSMQEMIKARMQLLGRDRTAGTVEKAKELLESERMKHR